MNEFIDVRIDWNKCVGIKDCGQCVRVCPVNIFEYNLDQPAIVAENLDECTLCNLCLNECRPNAIGILKLYESPK
jgi:NAD-dependent dihydropyrimidine dehydrogenase PreA subunit